MATARDMTQKQFEAACAKHGIVHEGGGTWKSGAYALDGSGTYPVRGLGGAPQLDISSRRALLACLLKMQARDRAYRDAVDGAKALRRGDRIERLYYGGDVVQAIVVDCYGSNAAPSGMVRVSYEGRRVNFEINACRVPTKRWRGPKDLVAALQLERQRLVDKLAALDDEIAGAQLEARAS